MEYKRTVVNESQATVEFWSPKLGSFTLAPGERLERPQDQLAGLTIVRTTSPGSFTILLCEPAPP